MSRKKSLGRFLWEAREASRERYRGFRGTAWGDLPEPVKDLIEAEAQAVAKIVIRRLKAKKEI